jgi:3,2-trans-enoyl-CoA isomerase
MHQLQRETIQIEYFNDYSILQLNRGTANPINLKMMEELSVFFEEIENDELISGVILTGKQGIFTGGIDVVELYSLNKEESYNFWKKFVELATQLTAFSKPLVAAISGHSPAGGCVLACCADFRLMSDRPFYKIGLNEIPVGIVVPERILNLYSFWIGKRKAYQNLMEGKLMSPQEAFEIGLIDELCEDEELLSRAKLQIEKYLQLPKKTWRMSKLNLRKSLIASMSVDFETSYGAAMEQFWSPENRKAMGKLVEKLK